MKLLNSLLLLMLSTTTFQNAIGRNATDPAFAFIENKGQIVDQNGLHRNDIQYRLSTGGMNVFVGNGQLHYEWARETNGKIDVYRMDVSLEGANTAAIPIPAEKQHSYDRYYLPQCPGGILAHTYGKITYQNVYPGIDWVLYTSNNQLKYDFVVHVGADPKNIRLKYDGATTLDIQEGATVANTPFGTVTEKAPYSYIAETGKAIGSGFLKDNNTIGFKINNYSSGTLIIDPSISVKWDTYYGGALPDSTSKISTDISGNLFVCGSTSSVTNIATSGAFLTTIAGDEDGFLVKFDSAGVRQWGTYYGGTAFENFMDASADVSGNVFCVGHTSSPTGIATAGAHKQTLPPNWSGSLGQDGMLIKFDASGARLWGTYYGGDNLEEVSGVKCDLTGNVYITGSSISDTGVASPGSFQPARNAWGLLTGFLAKFNSSGTRQWATYYGGNNFTEILDLDVSTAGDIIIAGTTRSDSLIATAGAHQTFPGQLAPPSTDGFLVKFNSSGTRLWGTYYGGFDDDLIRAVIFDAAGNIFAGGSTGSDSLIATAGAFSTQQDRGFIVKFNSAGVRQWGTYYPIVNSLDCDASGNVYVLSTRLSASQPPITVSKFNPTGSRTDSVSIPPLTGYSTGAAAYNMLTKTLFTSYTIPASTTTTTPGAHQSVYGGGIADLFIVAWKTEPDSPATAGNLHNVKYLTLYPNPNNGSFTLKADFSGNNDGNAAIEIVNMMGAVVYKHDEQIIDHNLNKQIKLDVPGGIYLLRIKNGSRSISLKFMVEQ